MKLIGLEKVKEGETPTMKFYGTFNSNPSPKVILTKKEAISIGLNLNNKKGYYIKIRSIRVPVDIK